MQALNMETLFTPSRRTLINLDWLIMLRWVAVFGQIATILVVLFVLGIDLPMKGAMVIVLGLTIGSNFLLRHWSRRWRSGEQEGQVEWDLILGLIMILDVLSLTTLLFSSGGVNNPFALFYFVNLSLSSLILSRGWAWLLNALIIGCFTWLLISHVEIEALQISEMLYPISQHRSISLMHTGYWLAFALSSTVVVFFLTQIRNAMRNREAAFQQAQIVQASREKLESLGTLAAGTAHELATPLSTIAIVARDVEQFFEENPPETPGASEVVDDIHLIRSQLDRCRVILDRMASQSGQAIGETIQHISVRDFWDSVLDEVTEPDRVSVQVKNEVWDVTLYVPPVILSQAMRAFVQNAIDADEKGGKIVVEIQRFARHWLWSIEDHGPGMPPDVLQRISEPFYTTKPTGKGMGLGVFLAKNVIERLDGTIDIQSEVGKGTKIIARLPRTFPSDSDQT
ncbi:MAG: ATP-binding protein [Pirellulaceae bacterium]